MSVLFASIIIGCLVFACWSAGIAERKGLHVPGYFFLGLFTGFIGVIVASIAKPDYVALERREKPPAQPFDVESLPGSYP